jgi:hypothetical protein
MQNNEGKARVKRSTKRTTIPSIDIDREELLQLVTFRARRYFELLRSSISKDQPIRDEDEHAIWSRLDQLRVATDDDENFVRAVERGVTKDLDDAAFPASTEMMDNLRYTFANGTDNQRRTAALIVIAKRLDRSS